MLGKKKLIKIIIFGFVFFVLLGAGVVLFRCYFCSKKTVHTPYALSLSDKKNGDYGFGRMIPLIEACQKVKELEHSYYFAKTADTPQVQSQTIRDLIHALSLERVKYERHLNRIRYRAEEATSVKKFRSLTYYLTVVKDCIQDLEEILSHRMHLERASDNR